jgi:hypothetical protein
VISTRNSARCLSRRPAAVQNRNLFPRQRGCGSLPCQRKGCGQPGTTELVDWQSRGRESYIRPPR